MNQEQQARDNAMWQVAYLREMGVTPVAFKHRSFRDYHADLQRQRAGVELSVDPKESDYLRKKARAVVAECGLEHVAGEWVPRTIDPEIASTAPEAEPSKKDVYNCRRKFSHKDYLAAMNHAARLDDVSVQIYPCEICGGLHVGHNPIRTRIERIGEKLAEATEQLKALERERVRLKYWKSALLDSQKELLRIEAERREDATYETEDVFGKVPNESYLNGLTLMPLLA
jgi:hypothetical protein